MIIRPLTSAMIFRRKLHIPFGGVEGEGRLQLAGSYHVAVQISFEVLQ
jgi:hypothetical protein